MNVYSLEEAKEWFLYNSSGSVICMDGDVGKVCETYQEAKKWYNGTHYIDFTGG